MPPSQTARIKEFRVLHRVHEDTAPVSPLPESPWRNSIPEEPEQGDRKRALDYVKRGMEFLAAGDRKGAWTRFTLAVRMDPGCPEAYFEMGRYQHDLQNLTAADRWYELTVTMAGEPDIDSSRHRALLGALVGRGMIAWQKNEWKDAVEFFDRAILDEYTPSDFIRQILGECNLRLGRIPEAVMEFQNAPWNEEGLMNFGLALFAQGDLDRAAATLRRAFFQCPNEAETLLGIRRGLNGRRKIDGESLGVDKIPEAVWGELALLRNGAGRLYAERCRELWEQTHGALEFLSALWTDPQVMSEREESRKINQDLHRTANSPERQVLKKQLDRLRSPVRIFNSQSLLLQRIHQKL